MPVNQEESLDQSKVLGEQLKVSQDILTELKKLNETLDTELAREAKERQELKEFQDNQELENQKLEKIQIQEKQNEKTELVEFRKTILDAIKDLETPKEQQAELVNKLDALTTAVEVTDRQEENAEIERNTNLVIVFFLLAIIPMLLTVRYFGKLLDNATA
ncbi:hypothetical protein [Enterococcus dispar]|uniref:hypothetical protein n=1 Tax=Enterococcus dispar TaxID=44009 RepID=UPI00189E30EB|nr:hypothetical protein [Enterococcus dispar]